MPKNRKLIVTMGDPFGIGPHVTVDALSKISLKQNKIILVGNQKSLSKHPKFKQIKKDLTLVDPADDYMDSGEASYSYLLKAVELLCGNPDFNLVTAPVSKEKIASVVDGFVGHTEFLAEAFEAPQTVMMMAGKKMKVVLLTRHILLRDIAKQLTLKNITSSIDITGWNLKKYYGIDKPKIALCSVNPHAGIDTFLDKEEYRILKAVEQLKKKYDICGPYPSDTLFSAADKYDVIVAAYHDQAMIPFKLTEFSSGVNVTLGLPFIRTSPAHGTAFDIASKPDKINSSSMLSAVRMALQIGSRVK